MRRWLRFWFGPSTSKLRVPEVDFYASITLVNRKSETGGKQTNERKQLQKKHTIHKGTPVSEKSKNNPELRDSRELLHRIGGSRMDAKQAGIRFYSSDTGRAPAVLSFNSFVSSIRLFRGAPGH